MKTIYYYKEKNGVPTEIKDDSLTLHREDGPACIIEINGDKKIFYYQDNELHREGGPAIIESFSNGFVHKTAWYLKGKMHRDDGPSQEDYGSDGFKLKETYARNGTVHREDGPAVIWHNYPGSNHNYNEHWVLEGKLISRGKHNLLCPRKIFLNKK